MMGTGPTRGCWSNSLLTGAGWQVSHSTRHGFLSSARPPVGHYQLAGTDEPGLLRQKGVHQCRACPFTDTSSQGVMPGPPGCADDTSAGEAACLLAAKARLNLDQEEASTSGSWVCLKPALQQCWVVQVAV